MVFEQLRKEQEYGASSAATERGSGGGRPYSCLDWRAIVAVELRDSAAARGRRFLAAAAVRLPVARGGGSDGSVIWVADAWAQSER